MTNERLGSDALLSIEIVRAEN